MVVAFAVASTSICIAKSNISAALLRSWYSETRTRTHYACPSTYRVSPLLERSRCHLVLVHVLFGSLQLKTDQLDALFVLREAEELEHAPSFLIFHVNEHEHELPAQALGNFANGLFERNTWVCCVGTFEQRTQALEDGRRNKY